MSLLDRVSQLLSRSGGTASAPDGLVGHVVTMLNDPATGGLPGLVRSFQDKGFGPIIASWVGTGANASITAAQIQHALGPDRVERLASHVGMTPDALSAQLSSLLPRIVDVLTPHGELPSDLSPAPAQPSSTTTRR